MSCRDKLITTNFRLIFRNTCSQSVQQLQDLSRDPVSKLQEIPDPDSEPWSTSLDLLLRFQRLLVAKLFPLEQNKEKAIASDPGKRQFAVIRIQEILTKVTHYLHWMEGTPGPRFLLYAC